MISGYMADILSNIYQGYSLVWYHHHHLPNHVLKDVCIYELNREIEDKMNLIIHNYPIQALRPFLMPLTNKTSYPDLGYKNKLYSILNKDTELYEILKDGIYSNDTVLEKMERLTTMDKKSAEYNTLYQDIISVGEFKIER